jgi:hypothetical protein
MVGIARGANGHHQHSIRDNVAPTYLRWQVVFVLDGQAHIELPAAFDMRSVIDAAVIDVEMLHLAQLSSGTDQRCRG